MIRMFWIYGRPLGYERYVGAVSGSGSGGVAWAARVAQTAQAAQAFWKVFLIFTTFLDHLFDDVSQASPFFSIPIFGYYFSVVYPFSDFLLFGRTLADTCFT